eukprot:SM000244S08548  [mRNA]  locus=s244:111786:114192:- [translate_table: standard]
MAAAALGKAEPAHPRSERTTPVMENGSGKRHAAAGSGPTVEASFRLLVPAKRVGSIIGKQGATVKQLREDTGAKIKITDSVPAADERVVLVSSLDEEGQPWSAAMEALLRLVAICSNAKEDKEEDEMMEEDSTGPAPTCNVRLLIAGSQAGSVIGKGGATINEIRETTGASVRVSEDLPAGSSPTDRLVQVSGESLAVESALKLVCGILRDNPTKEQLGPGSRMPTVHQMANPWQFPGMHGAPVLPQVGIIPGQGRGQPSMVFQQLKQELRLPKTHMGPIIGKGGANINQIRQMSGAVIKVHDQQDGEEDRVVEIAGSSEQVAAAHALIQAFLMSGQQAIRV